MVFLKIRTPPTAAARPITPTARWLAPDAIPTTTAKITVDKTSPKVGDTVNVTYTVVTPAASNPTDIALPADIMTPTGKVTLGGAQTGSVTVAGPKKNDPVAGKAPFPSFSMTGSFTVTQPGGDQVTFYAQVNGACTAPYTAAGLYCVLPQFTGVALTR